MSETHKDVPAQGNDQSVASRNTFFVVGIGASAGGLESLEHFFANVPHDSGMAFVVIQHLSPDFKSMMDELLARHTNIPIHRAEEGVTVEPNNIYLLPRKKEMIISQGRLHLADKDPSQGLTLPIDHFFRSLAQDCGPKSIAVVLSGTGSDGSRGVKDVHEANGLIVCEDEKSAKFDGMPLSAQQTGLVDLVATAETIPAALLNYISSPDGARQLPQPADAEPLEGVEAVFDLLRREYDIDFSHYKPTTVSRRIERRLSLAHALDLDEYVARLRDDREELNALYKDLLIGVTQFFRDTDPYQVLERQVIPDVLQRVPNDEEIRIWVAGCATGEEAYSLAILFHEALAKAGRPIKLKILATDVHKASLDQAGHGIFDEERLAQVSADRLRRFFAKTEHGYQISQDLRQSIVFAQHNIIKDAPFTNLDLISCRNLLIYFQPREQKNALSLFHFGLKAGGVMFLGSSETPGDLADEFDTLDARGRLYRKRRDIRLPATMRLPLSRRTPEPRPSTVRIPRSEVRTPEATLISTYDQLLDKFMPPSLLVNQQRELIETFAGAERFLRFKGGRVSHDLLDLLDTDAKTSIAGGLNRVVRHGQPLSFAGVRLTSGGQEKTYRLSIEPLECDNAADPRYLISLELLDSETTSRDSPAEVDADEISRDQVNDLEEELRYTKENLQATIEELETSNEEMQATNQELVASNEELQSTNEELHSVNEELYTVNGEHQKKIQELAELNQDMEHLLLSTGIHTLFLDSEYRVRRFTPMMAEVFHLLPHDVGRRIESFAHNIACDSLEEKLARVRTAGVTHEEPVSNQQGHRYLLRLLPYKAGERIEGVVVTLIDMAEQAQLGDALRKSERRYELAVRATDVGVWEWEPGAEAYYFSPEYARLLGYEADSFPGTIEDFSERLHPDDHARVWNAIKAHLKRGLDYDEEFRLKVEGDGYRWFRGRGDSERDASGRPVRIAGTIADIHRRKCAEIESAEQIRRRDNFLAMLSHELRNPMSAVRNATRLLNTPNVDAATDAEARRVIDRQTSHVTRLLDDLLDVSRITQDKIELVKSTIDLRETVEGAVQSVRSLAEECEINIDVNLPDRPLSAVGDPTRLEQIQANLLTNAIKYSPAGERVTLELLRDDAAAVIRVSDNGAGIAPELLDGIFDAFVQVNETLDRAQGGMGVGLTLVRQLAEMHGGTVVARSEGLGRGSEFEVRLPRFAPGGNDGQSADRAAKDGTAIAPGSIDRVVIIEDQEDNRQMLTSLLELEGIEVHGAADGFEGLELVERVQPQAAIVDIGLPEMDGYQVARRIRLTRSSNIMLVALTGYGQPQDIARSHASGFDHHLVKPLNPDRLAEVLGLDSQGAKRDSDFQSISTTGLERDAKSR